MKIWRQYILDSSGQTVVMVRLSPLGQRLPNGRVSSPVLPFLRGPPWLSILSRLMETVRRNNHGEAEERLHGKEVILVRKAGESRAHGWTNCNGNSSTKRLQ